MQYYYFKSKYCPEIEFKCFLFNESASGSLLQQPFSFHIQWKKTQPSKDVCIMNSATQSYASNQVIRNAFNFLLRLCPVKRQ